MAIAIHGEYSRSLPIRGPTSISSLSEGFTHLQARAGAWLQGQWERRIVEPFITKVTHVPFSEAQNAFLGLTELQAMTDSIRDQPVSTETLSNYKDKVSITTEAGQKMSMTVDAQFNHVSCVWEGASGYTHRIYIYSPYPNTRPYPKEARIGEFGILYGQMAPPDRHNRRQQHEVHIYPPYLQVLLQTVLENSHLPGQIPLRVGTEQFLTRLRDTLVTYLSSRDGRKEAYSIPPIPDEVRRELEAKEASRTLSRNVDPAPDMIAAPYDLADTRMTRHIAQQTASIQRYGVTTQRAPVGRPRLPELGFTLGSNFPLTAAGTPVGTASRYSPTSITRPLLPSTTQLLPAETAIASSDSPSQHSSQSAPRRTLAVMIALDPYSPNNQKAVTVL